ncbi:MAG TPA: GNAT family N-acetyltransferase [Gemmatimonadaceae bacterium]
MTARIGLLAREHRDAVRDILRSTSVFRDEEIDVALELFDQSVTHGGHPSDDDYAFVGAFDEADRLAGFACYGRTPDTDRTYDLYWLAVDQRIQRNGTGSLLVSAVEDRLREGRGRMVVAETSSRPDYQATRAFYEKRGFVESGRVPEFYAPGDDRVIYTKRLVPTHSGRPGVTRE